MGGAAEGGRKRPSICSCSVIFGVVVIVSGLIIISPSLFGISFAEAVSEDAVGSALTLFFLVVFGELFIKSYTKYINII